MKFFKKILVGAGIGGGLIAGIVYLFRLKRTSEELETETTVSVQKLDLKGLSLKMDITLKNPTRTGFKVKFPFVKVYYKNSLIGSSQVIDKDVEVPSFGQVWASNITIQIPSTSLLSIGASLTNLLKGQNLDFTVKTVSTIDLGVAQKPYERTDDFTLKLPTNAG